MTQRSRHPLYKVPFLCLAVVVWPATLAADDPGFSPCPTETPPSNDPPSSTVIVRILDIDPQTDLEGDDDNVPFYDNRADIYGWVTIDGETFELPKVDENDHPHWDSNGVFEKTVSSSPVHISIYIKESDGGLTGDDDAVDINPMAGKDSLDLDFDLCSLLLSGDIGETIGQTQNVISISGGTGSNDATIRFKVELEDGRPVSTDDLALVGVDLVQVVHNQRNLVAEKPTIMRVRLASNHSTMVSTTLNVRISGGMFVDDDFPVDIEPGEVKSIDLYTDSPLMFPATGAPYAPFVHVSIVDPNGAPPGDCRSQNDDFVSGTEMIPEPFLAAEPAEFWRVLPMKPIDIIWSPVGTLLDIGNCAGDDEVEFIRDVGTAFIKGTYPTHKVDNNTNPVCIEPPVSAASDFLVTVLAGFGVPADAVEPFVLLFELNIVAAVTGMDAIFGVDRFIGILPNNWFHRFTYDLWIDVTGLSLGEFAPHAVILMASDDGQPMMALPAHELGHTYGLSVAPEIKSWVCNVDIPGDVDVLACGTFGGYDEYKNETPIPGITKGKPSNGYWLLQGGEPSTIPGSVYGEQCDSHCLMAGSPRNAENAWSVKKRWIDTADYDQLLEKLRSPFPFKAGVEGNSATPVESIFISGMIAYNDAIYLGPWFRAPGIAPEHTETEGVYAFQFKDAGGTILSQVGLPANWTTPDVNGGVPVLFFGLFVPYAPGTEYVDVVNTMTGDVLDTRTVSGHSPEVEITEPAPGGSVDATCPIRLAWDANDTDGDALTFTVLMRQVAASKRFPVAYSLTSQEFLLNARRFTPGDYEVVVVATDGVNTGQSQPVTFTLGVANDLTLIAIQDVDQSSGADELVRIADATTGVGELVGSLGDHFINTEAIAVLRGCATSEPGAADRIFVVDEDRLLELDSSTGHGTVIGSIGFSDVDGIAFHPHTNVLYGITHGSNQLITIDIATGDGSLVASDVIAGKRLNEIAFHPDGRAFVLTDGTPRIYEIDIATGEKLLKWTISGSTSLESLLWSADGQTLYSAGDRNGVKDLVTIELLPNETAVATYVSETPSGFDDLEGLAWLDESMAVELFSGGESTDVEELPSSPVTRLLGNVPNPFNAATRIDFVLAQEQSVELAVFDVGGRRVATLFRGALTAGSHSVPWNGRDVHGQVVASGVYQCVLDGELGKQSHRIVLLK